MTASGCNGPSEVPTEEWANEVRDAVRQHVEGSHEVPIFRVKVHNPDLEWEQPTLTTYQMGNHRIYDGRYSYISFRGGEELYDRNRI